MDSLSFHTIPISDDTSKYIKHYVEQLYSYVPSRNKPDINIISSMNTALQTASPETLETIQKALDHGFKLFTRSHLLPEVGSMILDFVKPSDEDKPSDTIGQLDIPLSRVEDAFHFVVYWIYQKLENNFPYKLDFISLPTIIGNFLREDRLSTKDVESLVQFICSQKPDFCSVLPDYTLENAMQLLLTILDPTSSPPHLKPSQNNEASTAFSNFQIIGQFLLLASIATLGFRTTLAKN